MTATALALILAAAGAHAGWNLLAKQAAQIGRSSFQWLAGIVSWVLLTPVAVVMAIVVQPAIGAAQVLFVVGTAVLHFCYGLSLQHGYRVGDLSLVYPLARGTGPLLASCGGIVLFGERPGPLGLAGIVLVTIGVFVLGAPARLAAHRPPPEAVAFGLLTGLIIATYTVWDAYAVTSLGIPPLLYLWGAETLRILMLTPLAARRRDEVRILWHGYRRQVLGTAVLGPLSYILVLIALTFSPVSAIAPAREMSVLLAVLLGGRLLAEGHLPRRLLGAATIAAGVIAITVS